MESAKRFRNICILAHVDHGKTTLADHLIAGAGGGVLHAKMAGKLRFLDFRDDEQQRAITMKSACIMLKFRDHVIHLIDSPGHIDFCSEVSTAVRLSDGALILVDACEGVHIQTHAVLRQAWLERLKPCLVLNKLDRLITELKLSPSEAYLRMQSIIMEVNNIISAFRSEKYLSDVDSILAGPVSVADEEAEEEYAPEEEDAFSPEKGNIAFASAGDGWAFRIDQFADLYAAKLGASSELLRRALWGNRYYNSKTKKIVGKKASGGRLKPMFVQFVLEPLWQVYDVIMQGSKGTEMLSKIVKSMNLVIPPRELVHKDPKMVLQAVLSRWLPLSDNILSMVIECLPDPVIAQPDRVKHLLPNHELLSEASGELQARLSLARKAVETCDDSKGAPCVAFVSKMFAVPVESLPRHSPTGELLHSLEGQMSFGDTDGNNRECFLAFARIFSGVLNAGQKILVLSALYDPTDQELDPKNLQEAHVEALYLMMGSGLQPLATATAGQVVAIRGLGLNILKSATLSSTIYCWPFASMSYQAAPIVRVAIEPSDPGDMAALARGLRLLNQADPFVEVMVSGSGEHVIAAAGEVHLERCIKDLRERFACVNIEVSPPLVAFRETIDTEAIGCTDLSSSVQVSTPNGRCVIRVHVTRLPAALTEVLEDNSDLFRELLEGSSKVSVLRKSCKEVVTSPAISGMGDDSISRLRGKLLAVCQNDSLLKKQVSDTIHSIEESGRGWEDNLRRICALGPRRIGPNILLLRDLSEISRVGTGADYGVIGTHAELPIRDVATVQGSAKISQLLGLVNTDLLISTPADFSTSVVKEAESLESSVISGFQLATAAGPLCEEPLWGLAFTVDVSVVKGRGNLENEDNAGIGVDIGTVSSVEQYGAMSGQVISAVRDACRTAVLSKNPRIVEALYFCEVSTVPEHLGQVYAVLGRRRGRVLKEEMREGSAIFTVHAYMPVAESFGFANELRRKTSGAASPQLMLSHWEALLEDPFFVPKTEEELEEFGDGSSVPQNTARKLIDAVRRRKGLPVEDKVVQHATKQRTRARKV